MLRIRDLLGNFAVPQTCFTHRKSVVGVAFEARLAFVRLEAGAVWKNDDNVLGKSCFSTDKPSSWNN
jgi:hypothetical protein